MGIMSCEKEKYPYLNVDKDYIYCSNLGEIRQVTISTNSEWDYKIEPDWYIWGYPGDSRGQIYDETFPTITREGNTLYISADVNTGTFRFMYLKIYLKDYPYYNHQLGIGQYKK